MRVRLPLASKFGSYRLFVKYSDTPILLVNQKVLTCRSCFDSYCFEYMSSIIDDVCSVVNDFAVNHSTRDGLQISPKRFKTTDIRTYTSLNKLNRGQLKLHCATSDKYGRTLVAINPTQDYHSTDSLF